MLLGCLVLLVGGVNILLMMTYITRVLSLVLFFGILIIFAQLLARLLGVLVLHAFPGLLYVVFGWWFWSALGK